MRSAFANLSDRLVGHQGVLVDSNILIDVATGDPVWAAWSGQALAQCADCAPLVINPIIYAEVSVGYRTIEALNSAVPGDKFKRCPLPWDAGFLAGKCFVDYRRRGGQRTAPLPDFYIGAHAAIEGLAILTRDAARYRTYFPKLEVLAPAGQ